MENLDEINSINDLDDFNQVEGSSPINDAQSFSYYEAPGSVINLDSVEKKESVDNSTISTSELSMESETVPNFDSNLGTINDKGDVINNSEIVYNESMYNSQMSNLTSLGDAITGSSSNIVNELNSLINNISNGSTEVSSQNVILDSINETPSQETKISNEYSSTLLSKNNLGDSTLNILDDIMSNKIDVDNITSSISRTINSDSLNNVLNSSSTFNDQTNSETSLTEVSKSDVNVNKEVFPMNIDNTNMNTSSSNTTLDSNKDIPESKSSISETNTNTNTSVNNKTEEFSEKDDVPVEVNVDMGAVVSRLSRIEYLLNSTLDVRIKS